MAAKWIEALTGSLEQKKQYRQDRARIAGLPEPYRTAAQGMHRYLMYAGGITDGDTLITMFGDLADLWERAAVDGTPVRDIAGDDPVGFAEDFARAYAGKQWIDRERARLVAAFEGAEEADAPGSTTSGSTTSGSTGSAPTSSAPTGSEPASSDPAAPRTDEEA